MSTIDSIDKLDHDQTYDIATHGSFHLFTFKDTFYIYDIERLNVFEIGEKTFKRLLSANKEEVEELVNLGSPNKVNHLAKDYQEKSQPLNYISLNVAQVCNLSCVYCYGVDGEYGTKGKMPEDIAYQSVDFLIKESRNEKKICIGFFGGEPLLNFPLIKKVVSYSREEAKKVGKAITFTITTNGTKFSEEINKYLNENNFSVIVSFDGDEEAQNKNRPFRGGKDSYEEIKPKITNFLKSRNGKATARATITNHTTDLKAIKTKLLDLGFHKANATVATLSNYALTTREVDKVEGEQIYNIYNAYEEEAGEILEGIKKRNISSDLRGGKVMQYLLQLKSKKKNFHPCGVGRKMVGISITGDVYPCHRFVGDDKFKLGNVSDFNSETRSEYSKSHTQTHPVCSNCWAKYQCGGGGCIHDNHVMMGDASKVNTRHCSELKYHLKLAIHVYNNMNADDRKYLFEE